MSSDRTAALRRSPALPWLVLAVLALAQLMDVMDTTIVNIALPSAQADLGFSDVGRQWVVTAYALSFGALLLTGGRLADRFGAKRTLQIGLVGFALASGIGGTAQTFGVLITTRAFQGASGALLAPAALSLLSMTFTEPERRRRAFALFGGISGAGAAFGLLAGGLLTEHLSWRWGMYVNVPIAIVALVSAGVLIEPRPPLHRPRLDLPSALLAAAGLGALVYGFDHAASDGWADAGTIGLLGGAVALLVVFVVVQARVAEPLLPLRIPASRTRGGALVVVGMMPVATFAVFLFLVYYLQQVLDFSPVQSGAAFLPLLAGIAVGTALASSGAAARLQPRVVLLAGMVLGAAGLLMLSRLTASSAYAADIVPALVVIGLSVGPIFALGIDLATAGVSEQDSGVAAALVNALQQIGGALGIAVLNAVAASTITHRLTTAGTPTAADVVDASIAGYAQAFRVGAVILVTAGVVAALVLPTVRRRTASGAEPPLVEAA